MKYTVITGASAGIGREAALAFAKKGKNLVVAARRQKELDDLKQQIKSINASLDVIVRVVDLSISKNVYQFYDSLKDIEIEVFVNNAGFGDKNFVGDVNLGKIESMLNLNINALVILSNLFVKDYQNKEAQLINVSSVVGYEMPTTSVAYSASKFFVSAFTEGLAAELKIKKSKLKAKILAPALTETEFANVAREVDNFDYKDGGGKFHTASQMADFLLQLCDSDKTLGIVHINDYKFYLEDGRITVWE